MKTLKIIDNNFGHKESYEHAIELMKLILFVFLSSHFMAILYHTVALFDMNYYGNTQQTWLNQAGINGEKSGL